MSSRACARVWVSGQVATPKQEELFLASDDSDSQASSLGRLPCAALHV